MMGAGKTTIGKLLAGLLNYQFVDLDKEIERRHQKSIPEIFELEGESAFREYEQGVLKQLLQEGSERVLALGGGALQNKDLVENIKAQGLLIYLNVDHSVLINRLKASANRPKLTNADGSLKSEDEMRTYILELLEKREPLYLMAHITYRIEQEADPRNMAHQLLEQIQQYEQQA